MEHRNSRWFGRAPAALGLALLSLVGVGGVRAGSTPAPLTRVRFQLRAECTCASCGFAMQDKLHRLRGVNRVDLSPRDRTVTVTVDESQTSLSLVAAALASTEIGKHSALIGDLAPAQPAPELAALAGVEGLRHAEVDRKKDRLLLELSDRASFTTAGLTAALAKAGVTVRLDAGSQAASVQR